MSEQVEVAGDPLAFMEHGYKPDAEPVAEPQAEAAPEPEPTPESPARGPDGKFVAKEAKATEPPPEAAPAAPSADAVEEAATIPDGLVPVSVVQALRDEIKALKNPPAPPAAPPAPPRLNVDAPDPEADPEGFELYKQMRQSQWNTTLHWSGRYAEEKFGKDAVSQAHSWGFERCANDPTFNARVLASADPYGLLVAEHRKEQVLSALDDPSKLERLMSLLAADGGQAPQTAPVIAAAPVIASPPPPPRSLVSAPGTGAAGAPAIPVGPGSAFEATIRK